MSSTMQRRVRRLTAAAAERLAIFAIECVNEIAASAVEPGGTGAVKLSVRQTGDQIQLDVADDGVGMKDKYSTRTSEKRGADYVAIFVR